MRTRRSGPVGTIVRGRAALLALPVLVVLLGATGAVAPVGAAVSRAADASGGLWVRAGVNDPADARVAVLEFLPERVAVRVGERVTWTFPGSEPHSVTFVPTGAPQPRYQTDPTLAAPSPAAGPLTLTGSSNSGLLPNATSTGVPTFSVTFAEPGTYTAYCILHPAMIGTVDVGTTAEAQKTVTARGDAEARRWIREGRAARRTLLARDPVRTRNPDGSTAWTVEMGTSTEHTEVYAYAPSPATVRSGDTVTFVNNSAAPHTSSFGGRLVPLDPEAPTVRAAVPGPGPLALVAGAYLNTGWLPPGQVPNAAPVAVRSFSFVADAPGRYEYVCVLHLPSGMAGAIEVRD